ncbi:MAG: hypothetical protein ACOVO9_09685 [Bacteroidia bacterium]
MSYKLFGTEAIFAIEINIVEQSLNGPYGGLVLFINSKKLGFIEEEWFINSTLEYLMLFPDADKLFSDVEFKKKSKNELWNFFADNPPLERFQFVSGLGESFDKFNIAHFRYKDRIYFLWKIVNLNSSNLVEDEIYFESVNLKEYLITIDEVKQQLKAL